jgi:hypothetical protein
MTMARLTPEVQNDIVAFLRAGGFPHVACEAAGIPAHVFERWLFIGSPVGRRPGWKPHKLYTPLWHGVMESRAIARAAAEVEAHQRQAVRWLLQGPGKERPEVPGWSQAGRPQPMRQDPGASALMDPEFRDLLARLLQALEPFPEAREAAARALDEGGARPRRRGGRKPEGDGPSPGGGEAGALRGIGEGPPPDEEERGSPDQLPEGDVADPAVTPAAPPRPADPVSGESPEATPAETRVQGPGEVP